MSGIELRLLGGFASRGPDGAPLDIAPKKARALLAYLGFHAGKPVARGVLSSLIWGDVSADEQARRSLRQALTTLRRALPDRALETPRDEIVLCATADVDVPRFEQAARQDDRAMLEHALELYGGELLEGFMAHASGFDAWLERERSRLTALAADAMQRLCELQRAQGDAAGSMATAMRLVATDPVREGAHRLLMELYAEAGRASEAVRQFKVLRALLAEKLGTTPDARTTDLFERIRRSSERRQAQEPPSSRAVPANAPELRQACVLAIAVTGRSFDATLERDVEVVLARFGGSLMRVGENRAFGVFGFPRAHDDDLERGVRAALSLSRLEQLAGRATIGLAGGPLLVEYTAGKPVLTGDVLGRASELSEAERHGVLLTSAVARALGERLESEPAESELGARRAMRYLDADELPCRTPLVGRRYELAQLTHALELCAESGRGRTFLVRGEAGIGKTRLLRALNEVAIERRFAVHARSLVDFGDDAQGPPIQGILRELLAEEPRADAAPPPAATPTDRLEESDLLLLLDLVREVGREGATHEHGGRELFLRKRRAASCRLLAARSARSPRLISIDDIHWADTETLAQLGAWIDVAANHPLLLVVTTRIEGEAETPALRGLVRGKPVTTLDLAPLAAHEARELIATLEPEEDASAELVLARSGGNPLFIEQLVRFPQPNRVPASISSLVQARSDQLGPEDRATLQAASVLGQSFTLPALSHLLDQESPSLGGLIGQSLIGERGDGYRFVHALVRDAVYDGLPEERRTRLHASAARYYAGRDSALHAEHLDRAADEDAAAAYVHAATVERRAGGLERALELCERGRELAARSQDRHASALLHGELSIELGRCEASLESFGAAEASAPDAGGRARALVGRASALRVLDRAKDALLALASAERLLDPQRDPALQARIHYLRGNVLFPLGDWAACLESQTLALQAARRTGSALAEAQALSGIADAHYLAGRLQEARTFFAHCERVSRQVGALDLELTSRGMQCSLDAYALAVRDAAGGCRDVAERARAAGSLRAETLARVSGAWSLLVLGDWEGALSEASRAVAVADGIGAQRFSALGLAYAAIARGRLGDPRAAQAELERALALARSSGLRFSGVSIYAALLATAEEERIPALLEEADSLLRSGYLFHSLVTFGIYGVEAALRVGDFARAGRYADELERSMRAETHPLGTILVDFARTLSAWAQDPRTESSLRELERLRAALDAASMRSALAFVDRFSGGATRGFGSPSAGRS